MSTGRDRLVRLSGRESAPPSSALDLTTLRPKEGLRVLAVDQSFNATGVVTLVVTRGQVEVVEAMSLSAAPCEEMTGSIRLLARAKDLCAQFKGVLRERPPVDLVVMEQPPIGRGTHNAEVPLMAGLALVLAAKDVPVEMVHSAHWKKAVGGTGVGKKSAHATLSSIRGLKGLELVTNEGERDALCIGLSKILDVLSIQH